MGDVVVSLHGVSKRYGPIQALEGVALELRAGEVHCLAGENGAGKSTLIKILTGAIKRDSGEYLIDGEDIGSPSPAQAREAGIGVVYQELSLLPDLSVGENPRVLIFDEPTTALSEAETKALLARIHGLRDEGHAVMYVTHHLEEMFEIGDRVTVLRDGGLVTSQPMSDFDQDSLIASMVGRKIESLYPASNRTVGYFDPLPVR